MRARCLNPNDAGYVNYGAIGIEVCERWNIFQNFYDDMGERPEGCSLDRVDSGKGYDPGNCRWASSRQQNRNRRNNIWTVYKGEKILACEVADELQLPLWSLRRHLAMGLTCEAAIARIYELAAIRAQQGVVCPP
jgi:hypothetical protein